MPPTTSWYAYILRCNDGTFYVGSTNDVIQRVEKHNAGTAACRYTSGRRPVELAWSSKPKGTRSEACRLEASLKRRSRCEKQLIVSGALSVE